MPNKPHGIVRAIVVMLLLQALTPLSATGQSEPVRLDIPGGPWMTELASRAGDIRYAPFNGENVIWLRNNTYLLLAEEDFHNGTIEFEFAPIDVGSTPHFIGVVFRRPHYGDEDNIYFRAHKSGGFNAVQYAPHSRRSSTWQLYPEYNVAADLPPNEWTRVRVEVSDDVMWLFLNDSEEPLLTVPDLQNRFDRGTVGFWARVNRQPEAWATALRNVRVTPEVPSRPKPPTRRGVPGSIAAWRVSDPVQTDSGMPRLEEISGAWHEAKADANGLVNLTHMFDRRPRGRWTSFAQTAVRARRSGVVRLDFGYSDEVAVLLNGRRVFEGRNGWESRYPEYLGMVDIGSDAVFLHLEEGMNDLVFAISDDQRFGWGFKARIEDLDNVVQRPE